MKKVQEEIHDTRMDTMGNPLDSRTASEDTVLSASVSPDQVNVVPASIQQAAGDLYDDLFILRKLATKAEDDHTYDAIMALIELRMLQAFAHEGIQPRRPNHHPDCDCAFSTCDCERLFAEDPLCAACEAPKSLHVALEPEQCSGFVLE